MHSRGLACTVVWIAVVAATPFAQTAPPPTQTPIPRPSPFPGGGQPPVTTAKPPAPTATPAAGPLDLRAVDPRLAEYPGYPGAEFLESIDAGSGQRLFIFGTNDDYAAVVAFYKARYRKSEVVSQAPMPPIQQFDIGTFDSKTMEHRPGIIVKSYAWPKPTDYYIHVAGTAEKHFKTLIQIIPVAK